ncbi:MAG: hypothetical protein KGJ86_21780 [Chloroflexota bacterium]|nr:hypothetical protein [Chloroflexota bacterium]
MDDCAAYEREESLTLAARFRVDVSATGRLIRSYGTRAHEVLELAEGRGELEARTLYAVRREMALTVEDVLRRRTQLALGPGGGLQYAAAVARSMGRELGWDELEEKRQVASFAASLGPPS